MAKTPTDIRSLARSHTESAVRTLAGIMNEKSAPAAARVSAASVILDRGWGKAPQHITHERLDSMTDDQLRDQLREAVASLRTLGVDVESVGDISADTEAGTRH